MSARPAFTPLPLLASARALTRHDVGRQFAKFAIVGATNTVLSLAVYAALVKLAGVWYPAASAIAFAAGALNSYTLNRRWTFRAGRKERRSFARYMAVQGVGLAINEGLLIGLVGIGVERIGAQAIVLPLVAVLSFALNRQWAFRMPASAPAAV